MSSYNEGKSELNNDIFDRYLFYKTFLLFYGRIGLFNEVKS